MSQQNMHQNSPTQLFQIEPQVFFRYVIRYWYLLAISLIAGVSYSYYQIRYTPSTYTADSRMLVKDEYSSWGQEYFLPGMELVSSRNRLINEIGIIKSFPLMKRVALSLDWKVSYFKIGDIKITEQYPYSEFKIQILESERSNASYYLRFLNQEEFYLSSNIGSLESSKIYRKGEKITVDGNTMILKYISPGISLEDDYSMRINSVDALARAFQSSLKLDVENQESSILILSETSRTPRKSIDFLNTLMNTYIEWGVEQNNQTASNTIEFVDNQLRVIADSLIKTESRLEQFYKKNFSERIYVSSENSDGNMSEVVRLEEQLTQRSIQKEYYSALINTLNSEDFMAFPSSAVFGFEDPNVDAMILSIQATRQTLNEESFRKTTNSHTYSKTEDLLEEKKGSLIKVATENRKQVTFLMDSLKKAISIEEEKVLQIPKEQREYLNLQRENKLLSDLYTFLLNKRSEASIAKASNLPNAQVLDSASPYRVKYEGPNSSNTYTVSIFLSFALALGVILLLYLLNSKVIDPSDLENVTSIPIIGSISYRKGIENNLVVSGNLKSIVSESYRSIRTNLNFMTEGKDKVKILVTSSISGEGKTFTSINLASIYAASGKRTLILGADLRKPKIFDDFGLNNDLGLSTYLISKANLEEVTQKTKVNNLDLISSGPVPPNPAELIESSKMIELMEELDSIYDVVIIDSPPLGLVTDALLLKEYADAGLYIVRHNYTKKSHLKNIDQLYKEGKLKKLGIVVNAVKSRKGIGYGGGYGYGNAYGYGYGYGTGYGYYTEENT